MESSGQPTSSGAPWTPDERERYRRHLVLPEVGAEGQERLRHARVLIVGVGGLGSPVAMYLAAAGVGTLVLVDPDRVELSNLQRQLLHGTSTIGRPKTESARARLHDINPHVVVETHATRLTAANALERIGAVDLVVDGTDNFPARYLINDACVRLGKPFIHGSVYRFEGQVSFFWPRRGACYRCLYPQPPPADAAPNCAEGGVLGVLPGVIGCLQATEAIKWITGCGELLMDRLLLFDALAMSFRTLYYARDPACPVCGEQAGPITLTDMERLCRGNEQRMNEITPTELNEQLKHGRRLTILDVREPQEVAMAALPGILHIPLAQVVARRNELDPAREVVVMCRGGGRSAKAIMELRAAGYTGPLANLKGGIHAWIDEVDPTLPKC